MRVYGDVLRQLREIRLGLKQRLIPALTCLQEYRTALCYLRTLHGEQATHEQPNLANVQLLLLELACLYMWVGITQESTAQDLKLSCKRQGI